MALLSKEQILNVDDKKTELVEVPEWGGQVCIATMSGTAKDRFEASCMGPNGTANMQNIRARLVAACLVDDKGNLMFSEKEIGKLGQKSAAALDRVFEAAQRLNAVTQQDVEDLAKN